MQETVTSLLLKGSAITVTVTAPETDMVRDYTYDLLHIPLFNGWLTSVEIFQITSFIYILTLLIPKIKELAMLIIKLLKSAYKGISDMYKGN